MIKFYNLGDRLKYLSATYIIGYCFSLFYITGVINWKYLMPIKLIAVIFALTIGNALYFGAAERMGVFAITFRSIKYVILSIALFIFFLLLQEILLTEYGIDIRPFIGA